MTEPQIAAPVRHGPTRRQVLGLVAAGGGAAVLGLAACGTNAPAPGSAEGSTAPTTLPDRTRQVPGYYRFKVGSFVVTAISDGTFDLDADKLMLDIDKAELTDDLARSYLTSPVETSVNTYLIDTGSQVVLVDVGCGTLVAPTTGKFADNLRQAGYRPDDIGLILFTHLHQDHVGGLRVNGVTTFPHATVRILAQQAESSYWLDNANRAKASQSAQVFFDDAAASFQPYVEGGRLQTFSGSDEIVPGIRAVLTPGHTPGHTGYMIESGKDRLYIWGDIVHLAEVQFAKPNVSIEFDSTPTQAAEERIAAFTAAAQNRYLIAGAHLPFPGIGHVRPAGNAFEYVPANYTSQ